MILLCQQKVFHIGAKFDVTDESGTPRWQVAGEALSFGRRLHIYDMAGQERAAVLQKVIAWMPTFFLEVGGRELKLKKDFTFLKQRYGIEGTDWVLSGDFTAHQFELTGGGQTLMRVEKAWFSFGDRYRIEILDETQELACLCAVLAVDSANEESRR